MAMLVITRWYFHAIHWYRDHHYLPVTTKKNIEEPHFLTPEHSWKYRPCSGPCSLYPFYELLNSIIYPSYIHDKKPRNIIIISYYYISMISINIKIIGNLYITTISPGWWFQTCFIFHNIWDNPSHWLIFFKMVKTTNQIISIMDKTSFKPKICVSVWKKLRPFHLRQAAKIIPQLFSQRFPRWPSSRFRVFLAPGLGLGRISAEIDLGLREGVG